MYESVLVVVCSNTSRRHGTLNDNEEDEDEDDMIKVTYRLLQALIPFLLFTIPNPSFAAGLWWKDQTALYG